MRRRGFSLVESLIGLCLTLFILVSSLEFFGLGRRVFFSLKSSEEERLAATAALEKIRVDVGKAGEGLAALISSELVEGLESDGSELTIEFAEESRALSEDLGEGSTQLPWTGASEVARGRTICLQSGPHAEKLTVADSSGNSLAFAPPLSRSYRREETRAVLLGTVRLYRDEGTIRRKVNNSPAQPLVEDVEAWEARRTDHPYLLAFSIQLKGKEKRHEILVFAKNMALSSR